MSSLPLIVVSIVRLRRMTRHLKGDTNLLGTFVILFRNITSPTPCIGSWTFVPATTALFSFMVFLSATTFLVKVVSGFFVCLPHANQRLALAGKVDFCGQYTLLLLQHKIPGCVQQKLLLTILHTLSALVLSACATLCLPTTVVTLVDSLVGNTSSGTSFAPTVIAKRKSDYWQL